MEKSYKRHQNVAQGKCFLSHYVAHWPTLFPIWFVKDIKMWLYNFLQVKCFPFTLHCPLAYIVSYLFYSIPSPKVFYLGVLCWSHNLHIRCVEYQILNNDLEYRLTYCVAMKVVLCTLEVMGSKITFITKLLLF